jgi:hypothetical protein
MLTLFTIAAVQLGGRWTRWLDLVSYPTPVRCCHRGGSSNHNIQFPRVDDTSVDGQWLYVTNLTLNLPFAGANAAIDSAWTLQVQGYTVSKLRANIPPIAGD